MRSVRTLPPQGALSPPGPHLQVFNQAHQKATVSKHMGVRGARELSVPSTQFCCEPKPALKKKVSKKKPLLKEENY